MVILETAPPPRLVWFSLAVRCSSACQRSAQSPCQATGIRMPMSLMILRRSAAIELREGLAISTTRERRAAINVDPIVAQVV